jgi:alcohol dehydrogenase class IV
MSLQTGSATPFEYRTAGTVVFGVKTIETLVDRMGFFSASHPCLVTDKGIMGVGTGKRVVELLQQGGLEVHVFDDVEPEPSLATALRCRAELREASCDSAIGLGGGSAMDVAKAAALAGKVEDIGEWFGVDKVVGRSVPLVLIPTTAGTGSEVTGNIILINPRGNKQGIVSRFAYPDLALVDPEVTLSVPPDTTAATGMDALTHAIEGYLSRKASPITDVFALKAVSDISASLERSVKNPNDLEARTRTARGSMLAGMGFSNSGLGACHAVAMALGTFGVRHGLANAIALPHVMEFNRVGCHEKLADLAQALGEDTGPISAEAGAQLAVKSVRSLARSIGCPETLRQGGIEIESVEKLSQLAMEQGRLLACNPRPVELGQMRELCKGIVG